MPARTEKQRKAMAIAEHGPEKLYKRNRGMLKMSHKQLHDYAKAKKSNPSHEVFTPGTIGNLKHPGVEAHNEDVRNGGIKGSPFTPSGNKTIKRELSGLAHTGVGSDKDLHSDTTELDDFNSGEGKIAENYGKDYASVSTKKNVKC